MESHQILSKPKLGFSASFKEALKILFNHPKFISLIIFFSFPLLASLLAHQILLHPTFIHLLKLLFHHDPFQPISIVRIIDCRNSTLCVLEPLDDNPSPPIKTFKEILSQRFLISTLLLTSIIFFLDLLNTIATVSISAAIYGGNSQMGFKEMLVQVIKMVALKLKGAIETSLCFILLASVTLLGLVALSTDFFFITKDHHFMMLDIIFVSKFTIVTLFFGSLFVVLLGKYIEWSAVWNMGIVISILDKNKGYIAIGVASYLSRGSRRLGFSLMMVFFVLKVAFGLPCLYSLWNEGSCGVLGNVVFVILNCVGNVVMWVVLMVYFYDCKREFLEKKVDLENNEKKAFEAVQQ
ncbi:uncharacterized protein E5676_scaffold1119G00100 [Cucumis melo var. makuwa]|uniref:Transmembrane protein n=2 Tax=Cucumis melo TaxID=3656 RepID=A0A5D3CQZ0_CUCMM|nr:uncharacterized protein E6C27_scaffold135G00610 [Cucumis melo var. makuwa]TYK13985.1 uncharacterized protein E5676_scaffold1119G00100 [Cucumis melo var. makuwa]